MKAPQWILGPERVLTSSRVFLSGGNRFRRMILKQTLYRIMTPRRARSPQICLGTVIRKKTPPQVEWSLPSHLPRPEQGFSVEGTKARKRQPTRIRRPKRKAGTSTRSTRKAVGQTTSGKRPRTLCPPTARRRTTAASPDVIWMGNFGLRETGSLRTPANAVPLDEGHVHPYHPPRRTGWDPYINQQHTRFL